MGDREYMPIHSTPFAIQMNMLNEKFAWENHRQTLDRLAERGGLAPCEALAIASLRDWRNVETKEAFDALLKFGELTRQVEQLMATLERIGAMSVRFTCACGRPTGTGAIKSCADKALAALTAPHSSAPTDPGRADTKEERRIENELFAGDSLLRNQAMNTTPGAASELHIANEWADMAANGVQWLRNIRDGISTPEAALAEMEANADRIRALRATPPAPVTEGAQREAVALHGCLVYLIERGSPAEYWAGGSNNNWTSDACEARCYEHEAEAEFVHGGQLGEVRVCAHMFSHVFDEDGRCERCRKNRYELAAPPPPDRVQPERVEADARVGFATTDKGCSVFEYDEELSAKLQGLRADMPKEEKSALVRECIELLRKHQAKHDAAPPNDASGGVTADAIDRACAAVVCEGENVEFYLAEGADCGDDAATKAFAREIVRTIIEAADRARKPGYRKPTYDDAVLALEEFADNEIEAVAAMLAALQHIGAVIPDAGRT